MKKKIFAVLLIVIGAVGCKPQAPVTPPPTASVSSATLTCPSGYTCGYIPSRAICSSATTCPTPSSSGPYTPLLTAATALSTPNYTDNAPPVGGYVAYTFQFVYLTGPSITSPETGSPSPASTATLVALYPGTPGQPIVTTTAELAPPLLPDAPIPQLVAFNNVPIVKQPTVKINYFHRQ